MATRAAVGGGAGGGGGGLGAAVRSSLPLQRLGLDGILREGGPLSESVKLAALRALSATTPGWEDAESDHQRQQGGLAAGFSMRALTGGMTNAVFRCSKPSGENKTVLLRSYGKGTEMFFSREAELKAFKLLAEKDFGPALLATLEDGRVEEFLAGQALGAEDMRQPDISNLIARRVAELHALDMGAAGDAGPVVFRALEEFHRKALELCGEFHGGVDVAELGRLAAALRERLELSVPSKRVFCHNDLQCGNIMYSSTPPEGSSEAACTGADTHTLSPLETSGRVVSLIDYEYAGYNPRGFDLGNHFCEWMADYATAEPHLLSLDKYPSPEERRRFCRAYLGAAVDGVPNDEVSPEQLDALVAEADAYSLASHLLWAMWAVLQSKSEAAAPGFDYLKYAAERVRAYRHFSGCFLPPLPK